MEKTPKDPIQEIEERLAGLRPVEPRDPERHAAGRAAFLQQARALKMAAAADTQRNEKSSKNSFEQPVSNVDRKRQIGWNSIQDVLRNIWQPNQFWTKKEHPPMFTPIVTVLIVVTLLFGGAGATAYAAQDSLPADALYPVKTMTEDLRLNLSPAEQERLNLALSYAERRVGEIEALVGLDLPLSAGVVSRLGEQVEEALRLAAGMPEQARSGALTQIATRVNAMAGVLNQLQGGAGDQPLLTQASLSLHEQAGLAQMGLADPQRLQERLRERLQTRPWDVDDNPADGNGNDDGGNDNGNASGNGNANGNGNEDGSNANGNDANGNGDNGNGDDANSNAGNGNGDDGNANGDDSNGNGDDSNGNGDDANGNGNDANGNGNDDDANGNGNDDDANGNGGDDNGGNSNDGNGGDDNGGNGNDNGGNGNDDGGNGGDDNGGGSNDDGGSGGDDNGGNSNDDDGGNGGDDNGGDDKGGNGNGNADGSVTSLPSLINVVLRLLAAA